MTEPIHLTYAWKQKPAEVLPLDLDTAARLRGIVLDYVVGQSFATLDDEWLDVVIKDVSYDINLTVELDDQFKEAVIHATVYGVGHDPESDMYFTRTDRWYHLLDLRLNLENYDSLDAIELKTEDISYGPHHPQIIPIVPSCPSTASTQGA